MPRYFQITSPADSVSHERADLTGKYEQGHTWHLTRYDFAGRHVSGEKVLDVACGTGYGSRLLRDKGARYVAGADIATLTLRNAVKSFSRDGVDYVSSDGCALSFSCEAFDAIVSFETIEHIQDDHTFLCELNRVLKPGGICIISTPNRIDTQKRGTDNPYHVREYVPDEFRELLERHFAVVTVFGQLLGAAGQAHLSKWELDIQQAINQQSFIMRTVIEQVYRPLRRLVPDMIASYFVRRLLGISPPKLDETHIDFTTEAVSEASVLLAVCKKANT